jgi:hypothetical protein
MNELRNSLTAWGGATHREGARVLPTSPNGQRTQPQYELVVSLVQEARQATRSIEYITLSGRRSHHLSKAIYAYKQSTHTSL